MWNMEKGNHCRCDQGYRYLQTLQTCCPEKLSDAECRRSMNNRNPPASSETTVSPAVIGVIKDVVKEEVDSALDREPTGQSSNELKESLAGASAASEKMVEEPAAETVDASDGDAQIRAKFRSCMRKGQCLLGPEYIQTTVNDPHTMIKGPEKVSKQCSAHGQSVRACTDTLGCRWECKTERSAHVTPGFMCSCIDASEWQCGVKKKLIDCAGVMDLGPADMSAVLDNSCGRHVLAQEWQTVKYCSAGIRRNEDCHDHSDCPSRSDDTFAGKPECRSRKATVGCQAGSHLECEELGWNQMAAMYI